MTDQAKLKRQKAEPWWPGLSWGVDLKAKGTMALSGSVGMPHVMTWDWLHDSMHLSKQYEVRAYKMHEY